MSVYKTCRESTFSKAAAIRETVEVLNKNMNARKDDGKAYTQKDVKEIVGSVK